MTERPNGSFSRGNVYYHEIKWYYGRNKGFGISSLAQAFINCLTLSSYKIFLHICFLICKMHITVLSDMTIMKNKQHQRRVPAKPLAFINVGCFSLISTHFTLESGVCPTTSRKQRLFGLHPSLQMCSTSFQTYNFRGGEVLLQL